MMERSVVVSVIVFTSSLVELRSTACMISLSGNKVNLF